MRDLVLSIRADEACHREVNHHFADIPSQKSIDNERVYVVEYGSEKKEETIQKDIKREETKEL